MFDNKEDTINPNEKFLEANTVDTEATGRGVNFLSNGFELFGTSQSVNNSAGTYLYLAIAADPDTTTPVVAKSFDLLLIQNDSVARDVSTNLSLTLYGQKHEHIQVQLVLD